MKYKYFIILLLKWYYLASDENQMVIWFNFRCLTYCLEILTSAVQVAEPDKAIWLKSIRSFKALLKQEDNCDTSYTIICYAT